MSDHAKNHANHQGRFAILDALRFVLAYWVAYDHVGLFPLFTALDHGTGFGHLLARGWHSVVWGAPAVVGFFVISGFCIHLPFRHAQELPVARYYARRYLRILIPVAAAVWLNREFGNHQPILGVNSVLWNSILWSLVCEEAYYAVYPLCRVIRVRFGWSALLVPTFVVGVLTTLKYPWVLNGTIVGALKAAVILFPVWLLGCVLAEQSDRIQAYASGRGIWGWRFAAWLGSWICGVLHFHVHWPREAVMLIFGVQSFFWIRAELAYGTRVRPMTALARAGQWSYSLYLMHIPIAAAIAGLQLLTFGLVGNWFLLHASALSISYLFYLCVERPSHRLARRIRITVLSPRVAGVTAGSPEAASALAVE